jgi:malate synthase
MEDAATAEISRSQVWQWLNSSKGFLDDGRRVTRELVNNIVGEELAKLKKGGKNLPYERAAQIFRQISTNEKFEDFLTLPLYEDLP